MKRLIPLITLILVISLLASGFSCSSSSSRGIGGDWRPDQLGSGTISRLLLSERGYYDSESFIITSQTEFDDFISAVTQSWLIDTPADYPHSVLQWDIDFTTHNLILYWHTETSGGTVVTLGEPLVDGNAVTIDVSRGPLGHTEDMAYYRYAYKVSKAVTGVAFVGGGPVVFFRMSDGEVIVEERTQTYSTSSISDGILFQLSTDKMFYAPGEEVQISAYVENLTTEDFHYTTPSLGPDLGISIASKDEPGIVFNFGGEDWGDAMIRLTTIGGGVIKAGDQFSLDASWDQTLFYWGGEYRGEQRIGEPGQYTVEAIFEAHDFDPISVDIWIDDDSAN